MYMIVFVTFRWIVLRCAEQMWSRWSQYQELGDVDHDPSWDCVTEKRSRVVATKDGVEGTVLLVIVRVWDISLNLCYNISWIIDWIVYEILSAGLQKDQLSRHFSLLKYILEQHQQSGPHALLMLNHYDHCLILIHFVSVHNQTHFTLT